MNRDYFSQFLLLSAFPFPHPTFAIVVGKESNYAANNGYTYASLFWCLLSCPSCGKVKLSPDSLYFILDIRVAVLETHVLHIVGS